MRDAAAARRGAAGAEERIDRDSVPGTSAPRVCIDRSSRRRQRVARSPPCTTLAEIIAFFASGNGIEKMRALRALG
jgi:hypothetical protein